MTISLTERERAALKIRLNGHPQESTAARRRMDTAWTSLDLDQLPDDPSLMLATATTDWKPEPVAYEVSKDQIDSLLEWLEPVPQRPWTGFMGRIFGPVYDRLRGV